MHIMEIRKEISHTKPFARTDYIISNGRYNCITALIYTCNYKNILPLNAEE